MTILEKILSTFTKISLVLLFVSKGFGAEGDVYKFKWLDPKKKVYVLQNKIFPNKGSVYLNAGLGFSKLSAFNSSWLMNFNLGHFFTEQWGIEGFFNYYNNDENVAYRAVVDTVRREAQKYVFPHVTKLTQMYGVNLVLSPFYGKINWFNKIFYIDLNFGLGVGMSSYEHNTAILNTGATTDEYEQDSSLSFVFKTQWKWHLSRTVKISLDTSIYHTNLPDIQDQVETTKWIRSIDTLLSLGVVF